MRMAPRGLSCGLPPRAGRLHVGDTPGIGVDIDEKLAAKYPYAPKQLPIARLEDGSMWDW